MHAHPFVEKLDLSRIGIAEAHGHIVGAVHPEHDPALCHLQAHPGTAAVKQALVEWALGHFGGRVQRFGGSVVGIWVAAPDPALEAALESHGFAPT
ncbi:MAG TPA: hypothetical protein VFY15_01650, partial [Acidimicrobiia bacterium]|nr:hypothetical protein [Acidimicrobiia bacterium]